MTIVEAAAVGPVTVGARLYRWQGDRVLGVVVKAAYELRHRAAMSPMPPTIWRTRGNVAHPGDEPFPLRQAEIVVGPLPQVARAAGAVVALGVMRDDVTILEVRRVAGDEGARDAAVGFGPIAPGAPPRAALAGGLDPASLPGSAELELDDALDPAFFQAAPPAQRIDELRPGDALVLLGMSPVARVLHTTIPAQRGVAVVQVGGDAPRRIALRLDRVHVAPDAMVAELSYRFAVVVPEGAQSIRVAAGLDSAASPFSAPSIGSMPMTPVSVLADAPPGPARDERPPPTELLTPATRPIGGAPKRGTMVMEAPPPAPREPLPSSPFESTAVVAADAPAPSSLPFHRMPGSSPNPAARAAPIPGAPWGGEAAVAPPVGLDRTTIEDAPPNTMVLGAAPGASGTEADVVDLDLDLDVPPSIRAPAPPSAPVAPSVPAPAAPHRATLEDAAPVGEAPPAAALMPRPKADPWRKDPEAQGEGERAPAAVPPPPAPKAGPTRPDLSAGLYKRFKR